MGLFSSKKKTMVSSVVYNLAGDGKRTKYLVSTAVGNVLNSDPKPMGQAMLDSLLGGPGIRLRSFARWARQSKYLNLIGQVNGNVVVNSDISNTILAEHIPHDAHQRIFIQNSEIEWADYEYWAARYISDNRPELLDSEWVADYEENINVITITYEDGSSDRFTAGDYVRTSKYIYATYNVFDEGVVIDDRQGVDILLNDNPFPSVVGWSFLGATSKVVTGNSYVKTTTDITYTDGKTPPIHLESIEPTSGLFTEITRSYYRDTYIGATENASGSLQVVREVMHHIERVDNIVKVSVEKEEIEVSLGVIKTTIRTTERSTATVRRYYKQDSQTVNTQGTHPTRVFIYRQGSGKKALDDMFGRNQSSGTYFPFIPIRINNRFVSENYHGDVYAMRNRATQNSIGAPYKKIEDSIKDNKDLKEIDYAYLVYGVSLNTKETASLRYLYQFFKMIQESYDLPKNYQGWAYEWDEAQASFRAWLEWNDAQSNRLSPLFGKPAPVRKPMPEAPNMNVHIYSRRMNYDMRVTWMDMVESTGSGLGKVGAKKGDLWFTIDGQRTFSSYEWQIDLGDRGQSGWRSVRRYNVEIVSLWWQYETDKWRKIQIWGLKHRNMVYGGKSVDTGAFEALRDTDQTGFIIPLHEEVFKKLPITVTTQMSSSCAYVVFNCYQVVKKKWYQSGFFKFFLVAVAITISFYSGGVGAGILGANATVGAAIGFTGVAAAVAGAVANAVAAMVITQLITNVSTMVFGDKLGMFIATIASVAAVTIGSSMSNGQSIATSFGELMKSDNLLKLTIAGGDGYQKYMQASASDYVRRTENLLKDYQEQSRIIAQAYQDNLGNNFGLINPLELTQSSFGSPAESLDDFLSRTLMTGSDIAKLSMDMISNFASSTTSTHLPT